MDFPIAIRLPIIGQIGSKNKKRSTKEINIERYKKIISHFQESVKGDKSKSHITFGPASENDLKLLEKLKLPQNIALFFAFYEPSEIVKFERVLLYPVKDLYQKNTESKMGKLLKNYGYVIVAGTTGDDVYAIEKKSTDSTGQAPTFLVTGNALKQDTLQNIKESCYLVGTSFSSYLSGL